MDRLELEAVLVSILGCYVLVPVRCEHQLPLFGSVALPRSPLSLLGDRVRHLVFLPKHGISPGSPLLLLDFLPGCSKQMDRIGYRVPRRPLGETTAREAI